MQSLRHAPHRLGPPDRPGRRTAITVLSHRGKLISSSRLPPPPPPPPHTRQRRRNEPRAELLCLQKTHPSRNGLPAMPGQILHNKARHVISWQRLPPLATEPTSQETARFADVAQRLRHHFGKNHCRPTGSSSSQPTESASQPSASPKGMQTGFLPKSTSSDNGFSWRRLIFALSRKQNLSLKTRRRPFPASSLPGKTGPHSTAEADYSPW